MRFQTISTIARRCVQQNEQEMLDKSASSRRCITSQHLEDGTNYIQKQATKKEPPATLSWTERK